MNVNCTPLFYDAGFVEYFLHTAPLEDNLRARLARHITALKELRASPAAVLEEVRRCAASRQEVGPAEAAAFFGALDGLAEKFPVTAAVVARDEARCIARCLNSLRGQFDRILLLDTGSKDNTVEIAKTLGITGLEVAAAPWNDSFAQARNRALELAGRGWVFFIDADETYAADNALSPRDFLRALNLLPRLDILTISPLIVDSDDGQYNTVKRILRLDSGIRFYGHVHERMRKRPGAYDGGTQGLAVGLRLLHDGYLPQVRQEKDKARRNLTLLRKNMEEEPDNAAWLLFYARDGVDELGEEELVRCLCRAIRLSRRGEGATPAFHQYNLRRGYDLLMQAFFRKRQYDKLEGLLRYIGRAGIPCDETDLFFMRATVEYQRVKGQARELLRRALEYRRDHLEPGQDAMHSEGYHLDYLLMNLFCMMGNDKMYHQYRDFLTQKHYLAQ